MRDMNHTSSSKQIYRKEDNFKNNISKAWTVEM